MADPFPELSRAESVALIEQLRDRRKELGLGQLHVASELGTTQSHISDIETGRYDTRCSTLLRYARVVGMEVRLVPAV